MEINTGDEYSDSGSDNIFMNRNKNIIQNKSMKKGKKDKTERNIYNPQKQNDKFRILNKTETIYSDSDDLFMNTNKQTEQNKSKKHLKKNKTDRNVYNPQKENYNLRTKERILNKTETKYSDSEDLFMNTNKQTEQIKTKKYLKKNKTDRNVYNPQKENYNLRTKERILNKTETKYSDSEDLFMNTNKQTEQIKTKKYLKKNKTDRNVYNSNKQNSDLYKEKGVPNAIKTKCYETGNKNKYLMTDNTVKSDEPLDEKTVIDKITKALPKSKSEIFKVFHVDKDSKKHSRDSGIEEYEKYINETDDDYSGKWVDISEDENQCSEKDEQADQILNENSEHTIIRTESNLAEENNTHKTYHKSEDSIRYESNSKIKHNDQENNTNIETVFKNSEEPEIKFNADKTNNDHLALSEGEEDFLFNPDAEEENIDEMDEEMDYFLGEGKRNRKKSMMDKFTEKEQIEKFREELAFLPDVPTDSEDEVPYEFPEGDDEDKEKKFHYYPPAEDEIPLPVVDEVWDETDHEIEKRWYHYNPDKDKDPFPNRKNKKKLTKNHTLPSTIKENKLESDEKRQYKSGEWRKYIKKKSLLPDVKIISRKEWDIDFKGKINHRQYYPIGYISYQCTGTKPCNNMYECKKILTEIKAQDIKAGYSSIKHNFFVGGDSCIYEGRGWNLCPEDSSTDNNTMGNGRNSFSIAFIGTYYKVSRPPPDMITAAFNFVNYGKYTIRKIRKDFRCSDIIFNKPKARISNDTKN